MWHVSSNVSLLLVGACTKFMSIVCMLKMCTASERSFCKINVNMMVFKWSYKKCSNARMQRLIAMQAGRQAGSHAVTEATSCVLVLMLTIGDNS